MMRAFMLPTPTQAALDPTNSINQIVLRLQKALPAHGVELVEDRSQADLVVAHAGQTHGAEYCDVAHCHGLYPTAQFGKDEWHWQANRAVLNNVQHAKAVTVPSQWVADMFRRDMHFSPRVVPWAIDSAEWSSQPHQGYVLWNKTRVDGVCDPAPMIELAKRANRQLFLTTFGEGTPNIKTVGRQTYDVMRDAIQHAEIYLATSKETFGISTLEAMASGVPILGFRWGGTADLVEHGVTGYLVDPGDYDGLLEGLTYCKQHRDVLGANARIAAQSYTWDHVAEQFAEVYQSAIAPRTGVKVSVVIPVHNYAAYVPFAIASVKVQEGNFECVIVDDGSVDNSAEVIQDAIKGDPRFSLIKQANAGVAEARNRGIRAAKGDYVVCLDADDMLGNQQFLSTLSAALDGDPTLGIVFTGLNLVNEDHSRWAPSTWPNGFDFDLQVQGRNQIPTCCMFRREAWALAGGYRKKYTPAEDAELWLRIGALGYGAKQVVNDPWFLYRWHDKSLSTPVRTGKEYEPDWRLDKGWVRNNNRPMAALGEAPRGTWPVHNYDRPDVSVIVPVGAYHLKYLSEALDSVEAQTAWNWELIVVNDSGQPLPAEVSISRPYIRVVTTSGGCGASYARNRGIEAAKAPLVTFLDADDLYDPMFVEYMLKAHQRTNRYAYCDWNSISKDGRWERNETPEYDPNEVFRRTSIHSINVLIPRQWCFDVGLFNEGMHTWEDVEFFMKLAAHGYCGIRVSEPLLTYRYSTGQLREQGELIKDDLKAKLRAQFKDYIEDGKMCSCNESPIPQPDVPGESVLIEYNGPAGMHTVIGRATRQAYGYRSKGDVFKIDLADVQADPESFLRLQEISPAAATPIPPPPELIHV